MLLVLPWRDTVRRLPRVCGGLVLFGVGIAMMVVGDLGLGPWDVFHQGLADLSGIDIGLVIILVGVVVLAGFIPLREKAGLGTLLNAVLIGLEDGVHAYSKRDGSLLWQAPLPSRVHGLAVANGQLIASTAKGGIHAFGP
mgnify:CR=1 FL=1